MEPFRVICETCRTRLKVRSAEAIGEIHACPKCGSMVQIAAPAGWNADVAIPAVVAAGMPASSDAALTLSTSSSTNLPADFAFDVPLERSATAAVAPAVVETVPVEIEAPIGGGMSPLLWCAVGGAALFVAAGLTYVLWPHGNTEIAKPAAPVAAATVESPATDAAEKKTDGDAVATQEAKPVVVEPKPEDANHAEQVVDSPKPAMKPDELATPADSEQTPDSTRVAATALPSQPVDPPATVPEVATAKPETKPATKIATATPAMPTERPDAPSAAGSHVLKFDPLDFDPEHLSLSTTPTTVARVTPDAPTNSIPADAPATAPAAVPEKAPAAADILPAPAANKAVNVRRGPAAANDAHAQDKAQHLATRVKALQLAEQPLSRFIDTISEMSGAPITLDPITLELNGQSPRTAASVDVTNVTLEKALQTALANDRLELAGADGRLGIALAHADEQKAVDFDVKDLVGEADASSIAKLLERFVAPKTWKANGGKGTIEVQGGTLHIDQTLAVRREALIFCERLRLARGRAPRSKYPADLLTVDSPYEKLSPKLNAPTTFTFLAWTRFADATRQWQELSGLTILVDWSALGDVNLIPSSPIACSTLNRPWSEALDGVLEPLGLAWWAVDKQTIQITTLDALAQIQRVEFYPIPKTLRDQFAASDALVAALQKEIGDRPSQHGKPGDISMQLDEPSGRLIVRTTPDVQRFLSGRLSGTAK